MLLSDAKIDTDGIESIDDLAYDKIDELSREESRRIRNQNTPSVGEPQHE